MTDAPLGVLDGAGHWTAWYRAGELADRILAVGEGP
jgi:hypothetical protein